MSDTVVDSSVVAKWILPEPDSTQAERLIAEVALKGERLIVLDLAFVEVANAIWKLHHRGLATLDEARQFLDKLLRIPVHIEPANRLLKPALEIAANTIAPFTTLCLSPSAKTWGCRASRRMNRCITRSMPTSRKSSCHGTGNDRRM